MPTLKKHPHSGLHMTPRSHLNLLESSGLIRLAATRPELEYLFRHALVQDAAYQSLLKQDRRQLHAAVGEALERLYPGQLDELAPTLAHHFERAGARDKAVRYLVRAGDRARAAYANQEAIAFFQAAVEQLGHLLRSGADEPVAIEARIAELQEKVADLLELTGLHEAARELPGGPGPNRGG